MPIRHKMISAVVVALLTLAAYPSRASDMAASPGSALEAMAQQKFGPALSAAERKLLHFAPAREVPWVGPSDDPDDAANDAKQAEKWGAERTVRAELIVWLLSEPSASHYVHPSGLALAGARIDGSIDLSYASLDKPLTLIRCYLPGGINLTAAHTNDVAVRHSRSGPILGDGATIHGNAAFLFNDSGAVSLMRARIDGTLDFTGTQMLDVGEDSVNLVEANIGGDVLFHDGFVTDGIVYARLARIGHDLSFHNVEFRGDGQLDAERAIIDGTFYWVEVRHTAKTVLDLEGARAGAIWDDEASWPAPGNLMVNGFVYDDIAGGPANGPDRLRWLALQPQQWHPQPYRQLAKVLGEMGNDDGVTQVRMAKEIEQRRIGHESLPQRAWSLMLQYTIGFGYKPLRALWWIAGFVGLGTILFAWGYRTRLIAPTEEPAYREFVASGEAPPHYPLFNAFVYSLENFLPVVELHQDKYWRPNPRHVLPGRTTRGGKMLDPSSLPSRLLRAYLWIHILAGWTITPLLFAGLSGLVHPD